MVFFIIFLLSAGVAFIPASLAKSKGYSYAGFWLMSCFLSFVIAIIIAACLPKKQSAVNCEGAAAQTIPGYCRKCGAQMIPGGVFCSVCGTRAAKQPKPDLVKPTQDINSEAIKGSFFTDYMGFVLIGALFIITLITCCFCKYFFTFENLRVTVWSFPYFIALAMAIAVTARAKGPDLSIGSISAVAALVISLNADGTNDVIIILLALLVCIAIGFVNGVLTVKCKLPALISTLITGYLINGIVSAVTHMYTKINPLPRNSMIVSFANSTTFGPILMLCLSVGIPVLFAWLSSKKRRNSGNTTDIFAYIVSAFTACLVGFYILGSIGAFTANFGDNYETFFLFICFAFLSSRLTDSVLGILYAAVPAVVWAIFRNAIILLDNNLLDYISAAITLVFAVFAFSVHRRLGQEGFLLKK